MVEVKLLRVFRCKYMNYDLTDKVTLEFYIGAKKICDVAFQNYVKAIEICNGNISKNTLDDIKICVNATKMLNEYFKALEEHLERNPIE